MRVHVPWVKIITAACFLCCLAPLTSAQVAVAPPIKAVSGIEAPEDVQNLLNRVREALGGTGKLASVRSLLIEGERTVTGAGTAPFTYRLSLPNHFQRIDHGIRFSLDGPIYWQSPDPGESAKLAARRNTTSLLAEQSLTLLLRPTLGGTLQARLDSSADRQSIAVIFTGVDEFNLRLEIDAKTYRPKAFSRSQTLRRGDAVVGTSTRRVTFEEFQQIKGITFPLRMTETIEGFGAPATIKYNGIRVNEGVTAEDFKEGKVPVASVWR